MNRHEQPGLKERAHETCQQLLPWYDNGTLMKQEIEQVDRHLADCGACRSDLESMRDLRASLREAAVEDGAVAGNLAEVLARINAEKPASRRALSTIVRVALIAQAAAIILLAAMLVFREAPRPEGGPPSFHTLSDPGRTLVTAPGSLRIVFDPTAQETQIRSLLQGVGAVISGGPSPGGIYTIRVDSAQDLSEIVGRLRADATVRLVEPIATQVDELR